MAYQYELATIICQTFEKSVGKWQAKKPEAERKAMLMSFSARIDHDKEEGYRQIDLLIYGSMNYVQVWTRKRGTVIALEDLEDGDDAGIKPGKDYTKVETPWELLCDHDSGWRTDGIQDFLRKNERDINGFDGPGDWYTVVPAASVTQKTPVFGPDWAEKMMGVVGTMQEVAKEHGSVLGIVPGKPAGDSK